MSPQYDLEFFQAIEPYLADINAGRKIAVHEITSRRIAIEAEMAFTLGQFSTILDVEVSQHKIQSLGETTALSEFRKKSSGVTRNSDLGSGIYHTHGGGFFSQAPSHSVRRCCSVLPMKLEFPSAPSNTASLLNFPTRYRRRLLCWPDFNFNECRCRQRRPSTYCNP